MAWMRRAVGWAVLLLAAGVPLGPARADRQELYTVIGYEPGVTRYDLGRTSTGSATRPAALGFTATGYYGLTNTWHVGGRLHFASSRDVRVANAVVTMPGGSRAQGDVYEDHRAIGVGAVLLYRFDTHAPLAPVLELEGGLTSHQYSRVTFIPNGDTHSYPQSGRTRMSLDGSAAFLMEYRFATRWVVSAGVAAQGGTGGDIPWSVRVPLRLGMIW